MTDPVFQKAFENVRKSWADEAWASLSPKQITSAIYREIRRLDAEAANERPRSGNGSPNGAA